MRTEGKKVKSWFGSGGIRTHAPEETGALNQRLRPLGHATFLSMRHPRSEFNKCLSMPKSCCFLLKYACTFKKSRKSKVE